MRIPGILHFIDIKLDIDTKYKTLFDKPTAQLTDIKSNIEGF